MIREASLTTTEQGLVPASDGWFVVNAREARWLKRPGGGVRVPLTGIDAAQVQAWFPMLGLSIRVVAPGEPSTAYHAEADQEGFLVLAGEAILIIEGEERTLSQWDFVHCPPGTRHAFVGAGAGPCVLLCAGSRQLLTQGAPTSYCADPVAARHNASPPQDTQDAEVAYARIGGSVPVGYQPGWLP